MLHFALKTRPDGEATDARLMRVLIVEDNKEERDALARWLTKRVSERMTLVKVEIIGAATLASGLELAETANCTVLDLTLPDSDAENTRLSIKKFRPPVIITTGDASENTELACVAAGAHAVLVKQEGKDDSDDFPSELAREVCRCLVRDLFRLNGVDEPNGTPNR